MRLLITTPLAKIVDQADVGYVRAEDATGAFGILPGHADFLTTLAISVVTWRHGDSEHHAAVRGGVLSVRDGDTVSIQTREAIGEDTPGGLGDRVLARLREDESRDAGERVSSARLEIAVMRQIQRYLATGGSHFGQGPGAAPGAPGRGDAIAGGDGE